MKISKFCACLAVCLAALAAAGCGNAVGENTAQGMKQIGEMDYEGALASFEAAALNKEDMQMVYRGQGIACIGMTDYENAAAYLEKALALSDARIDQMDFDINYYLATAYYRGGQIDRAVAVYQAITDLRPKEKDAWYLKGTLELEQGKVDAAREDFEQAVSADKSDYDMLINIFISCRKYGHEELGAGYLQTVLGDESLKLSDYDKGRMSFYLGDYETARLCLEKVKDARGADAVTLLGQSYENLGDYNYAASVYSTWLETRQQDAEIYNQLGLCKLTVGEYEAALQAFQAGLAMEGNNVMQSLRFNEIVAYEYLGRFDEAKVAMQQYLSLYPDDEKAQRENVFLQTR